MSQFEPSLNKPFSLVNRVLLPNLIHLYPHPCSKDGLELRDLFYIQGEFDKELGWERKISVGENMNQRKEGKVVKEIA